MAELKHAPPAIRDQDYFLDSIYFKVEDGLFQVPRMHFERNEVFATLFTLPTNNGSAVEGSSEGHPLVLEGITKSDFRALLRVLYPTTIPDDYADIPLADWTSVLLLSTMWEFDSLRALAIEKMSARSVLTSAKKIILGHRYGVNEWFVQGCTELVTRGHGPTAAEMDDVGTHMGERIYNLREGRAAALARSYLYGARERVEGEFRDILQDGT